MPFEIGDEFRVDRLPSINPCAMLRPGSMIKIRSVVPTKYKIVVDGEHECPLISEHLIEEMISRGAGGLKKRRSKKKSKKTKRYKRSKKTKRSKKR